MIRRIAFIILWTLAFAAVTLLAVMGTYAVLGIAGIASWSPATVGIIGRVLSFAMFAIPGLGLILGVCAVLPGTK